MFWYYTSGQGGSEMMKVASRRPGAAECRNECQRALLESRRAGDGAHRDIERGKIDRFIVLVQLWVAGEGPTTEWSHLPRKTRREKRLSFRGHGDCVSLY